MKKLIEIDPKEFGLKENVAEQIAMQFKPMLDKMTELEVEFNEIVDLPIDSQEASNRAKELKKKYVKIRTATADIHKKQKEFYLSGGRYVDGWKNAQIFASQGKEKTLLEIQDFAKNKEKKRLQELNDKRLELVAPYVDSTDGMELSNLEPDVFEAFLSIKKKNHQAVEQAKKEAEDKRIAERNAEIEERRRLNAENEKLKKEAQLKEKEQSRLRDEERKRLDKIESEKKKLQDKIEAQEREKINAEIEKQKQIEKELQKGDAQKLRDLVSDIKALKTKYTFKSLKNKDLYLGVSILLDKTTKYIIEK